MDGVIEGTQLHNPVHHARSEPAKKPIAPPEVQVSSPPRAEQQAVAEPEDTPPWEEAAGETESEPKTETVLVPQADAVVEHTAVEEAAESGEAVTEVQAQADEAEYLPHTEDIGVVSAQWEEYSDEGLAAEAESVAVVEFAEMPPEEPDSGEEGEEDLAPPPIPDIFDGDSEDAPAVFAAVPDLNQENWPAICKQLAPQLGSAQMLTLHTAWVGFDETQNELTLSISPQAAGTVKNRDNIEKIRQALADAYVLPALKLQNLPWQDDAGWETPTMRRQRLQEEGKARAQQLLEADVACQQLMEELDCRQWRKGTVDLLANLDE